MKIRSLLALTGLPILVASLCCLAPVVLVLAGFSSVALAASLTTTLDGHFRWLFLLSGLILLTISLIIYYRRRGVCTLDQVNRQRNEIINTVAVVFIAAVIGYVIFFYGFTHYLGKLLGIWT